MATITVRDLDERTRDQLRVRAARNGRSMEAEVREILKSAVAARPRDESSGLGSRIHALFADIGGAEDLIANIPPRGASRREVDFSGPEYAVPGEPVDHDTSIPRQT
ncbi:FitA-like ribbon-helix-helix domain-containing protein [Herbiconiux liukaitaii]|uniref:FitA-like ribbon-helix-helix domain-containing protein n=1 Tax=Herbiconiux liukaitaii TaxID=3342799 RepID=UPI0035B786F6